MFKDISQHESDLLAILRQSPDRPVPIATISVALGLPPDQVHQNIRELANRGYSFETDNEGWIKLIATPDILLPHEISRDLQTKFLGKKIYSFNQLDSTNSRAYYFAECGDPEGTIVIADRQVMGKGRMGRNWFSPGKVGIYFTIILRPNLIPDKTIGISLVAAVSIVTAIRQLTNLPVRIKWPNDILYGDKKLAGILTELSAEGEHVRFVIVGIGVNVNHSQVEFPPDICTKATSLKIALGTSVSRIELLQAILTDFESRYQRFLIDGLESELDRIRKYSSIFARKIRFRHRGQDQDGIVKDIDEEGRLVVSIGTEIVRLRSGEVTLTESYEK